MHGIILRKYGVATNINFVLYEVDGVDFRIDAVHASGDSTIVKDNAVPYTTDNGFVDEGRIYSLALTASEMQATNIVIYIVDQSATKMWLDTALVIETYGHASAQHAFDLDTATQDVGSVSTVDDKTGYALTSGERASVADAVWDEAQAGHVASGSFGQEVQSHATKTELDAGLAGLNDPTATTIADAILARDFSAVVGAASRSMLNALRALRNRVLVSGTTMTVYEEDDAEAAWTAVVSTDSGADPITEIDPA